MVFVKKLFKKDGIDLIMIMCNTIAVLTITGRTFDDNIWFLFNPFVGWLNFVLI